MRVAVAGARGARSRSATARSRRPRTDSARRRSRSSKTLEIIRQKSVSASKNSLRSPGRQTRWTTPQRCSSVSAMLTAPGRHREPLADGRGRQRLGRDEEHRPDPAEALAEAPVLDDVADGVGGEELGLVRGGRGSVRRGSLNFQNR